MQPALRNRLILAGGSGALAIAGVLAQWFEGTGPTVKQPSGAVLYKPYRDTGDIWTVCNGHTSRAGAEVDPKRLHTQAECDAFLQDDLRIAEAGARRQIKGYDTLNEWQQAALIDFVFNLGEPALAGSTMRRMFNDGDIEAGCAELRKWVKGRQAGKLVTLPGLESRRDAETELCSGGTK